MMEMGFRAKRSRPQTPTYLLRQPADQRRTTYSVPKNTTSTISCEAQAGEPGLVRGVRGAGHVTQGQAHHPWTPAALQSGARPGRVTPGPGSSSGLVSSPGPETRDVLGRSRQAGTRVNHEPPELRPHILIWVKPPHFTSQPPQRQAHGTRGHWERPLGPECRSARAGAARGEEGVTGSTAQGSFHSQGTSRRGHRDAKR